MGSRVGEPRAAGSAAGRVGVFGSAFDPPHLGHLILVGEARWRLRLDRILVVPTGDPYHKESGAGPGPEERLALAGAAFGGADGVHVLDIEVSRPGPSYTCDTLEKINAHHEHSQTHLLTGSDAALGLGGWQRPERILELARVGVAPRSDLERAAVERVFDGLGATGRLDFFEMPRVDISSGMVRERIASGGPWRHLVPAPVASIIDNEGLYGNE